MFDLKKAKIYQAVKWGRLLKYAGFLKKLFLVLFIFVFLIFLYGFVPENFSKETNKILLGLSIIFLVLFLGSWIKESFFNQKLKQPKIKPGEDNLAEFLSFEAAKAVNKSISSTHLFYLLLRDNPKLDFIFSRALLNFKDIKNQLKNSLNSKKSESFENIIFEALKIVRKKNHLRIQIGDILSALAENDVIFKRILNENKLKKKDIENLTRWLENIEEKIEKSKRFWEYENLAKKGTLAKEWTAGYTITLDRYSKDLTNSIRKKDLEFVGHKEEIKITERILARGEINNVLIIGEPGTGKRSMVYALTQKSLLGRSLPGVNYKRIVELDMPALLAQMESSEKVEAILDKIFQEVVLAGNIILLVDGLHNYIGQDPGPGIIDISGIITPYLRFPQFQIIALTNYEGLHKYIERNSSILSLFEKVEVSEISKRETLILLEYITFGLEKKHKIFISYPAIREIVSLTDRYFPSLHFPEKAIDILDEAAVYVGSSIKEKIVLPEHIAKIITEKTQIPVGEIEAKEREVLLNLENLIHQRIINQDQAVKEVSTALRRARSEVTVKKGLMGGFLFLGPTGVGKTETAKALAQYYFGSEKKMIRLDMSEFQDIKDIPRLIGSSDGTGLLTTPVRENPFSLILLDEIEKAHPNILNLFLQVLDEGHLIDGLGRKINFKNTMIIATSNAGYKVILKALREKQEWLGIKQKLLDYLFEHRIFRPEFINRFDAVVLFSPLSKENLLDISELMLGKLKKNLEEKGIEFIISQPLKEKIVELSYNPVFGAREMRRVIQDKVENVLASALLSKELVRGSKVEIDPKGFKMIINQ
ncbi:ATP-dependent Clp protease ATP-binding subunit [Patescibacteria group bacterium]|nr:ATP-dependent Clp protease ATP-binding subunit [Patescibacteria group bacterium]